MNNIFTDISNFLKMIITSDYIYLIITCIILFSVHWLIKDGAPIYKEMELKHNSKILALILAFMAAFADLVHPNTYRARSAQDIIKQFCMVIVSIIFTIILCYFLWNNWDFVLKVIRG